MSELYTKVRAAACERWAAVRGGTKGGCGSYPSGGAAGAERGGDGAVGEGPGAAVQAAALLCARRGEAEVVG